MVDALGAYPTIQSAVDAASDGDTVYVVDPEATQFRTPGFVIDGKGLNVVGRIRSLTALSSCVIRNVPNGSTVTLKGLPIRSQVGNSFPVKDSQLVMMHWTSVLGGRAGLRSSRTQD